MWVYSWLNGLLGWSADRLLDRSLSSRRRMISERSSSGSGVSRGFSWPRIGRQGGPKGLRSSASRRGRMLRRRVRRLTDVSAFQKLFSWLLFILLIFVDGYGHLILRVEFAKRAT